MLQAGARGVVYGRNIFQHPRFDRMAEAVRTLVHEHADMDAVLGILRRS